MLEETIPQNEQKWPEAPYTKPWNPVVQRNQLPSRQAIQKPDEKLTYEITELSKNENQVSIRRYNYSSYSSDS